MDSMCAQGVRELHVSHAQPEPGIPKLSCDALYLYANGGSNA